MLLREGKKLSAGVVAAEVSTDPMGLSKLSEIESRVEAFYSHIRQSLTVGCPVGWVITLSETVSCSQGQIPVKDSAVSFQLQDGYMGHEEGEWKV